MISTATTQPAKKKARTLSDRIRRTMTQWESCLAPPTRRTSVASPLEPGPAPLWHQILTPRGTPPKESSTSSLNPHHSQRKIQAPMSWIRHQWGRIPNNFTPQNLISVDSRARDCALCLLRVAIGRALDLVLWAPVIDPSIASICPHPCREFAPEIGATCQWGLLL